METHEMVEITDTHHSVQTDILIAAPVGDVWRVLTDFASMPDWSPSFKGMTGDFVDGGNVVTRFDMGEGVEEYPATLILSEGCEFGWSEDYDGIEDNHRYRVEAVSKSQTRFLQTWATTADLAELYLAQYVDFNRALKAECERRFAPSSV